MPSRTATDEQRFLASYDASRFAHPSVAVDVTLVTVASGKLCALLIRRDEHPHRGHWALPGGFVQMEEALESAAARVLKEKAGLDDVFLEQLYTFGEPNRDPRTRVITVGYYALVEADRLERARPVSGETCLATLHVPWKGVADGPAEARDDQGHPLKLAFDHDQILGVLVKRLRGKLKYAPIGFELIPRNFTLRQLQEIYEAVLGRTLNKDSFRRSLLVSGWLRPTGKREVEVGHRPAELYRLIRQ